LRGEKKPPVLYSGGGKANRQYNKNEKGLPSVLQEKKDALPQFRPSPETANGLSFREKKKAKKKKQRRLRKPRRPPGGQRPRRGGKGGRRQYWVSSYWGDREGKGGLGETMDRSCPVVILLLNNTRWDTTIWFPMDGGGADEHQGIGEEKKKGRKIVPRNCTVAEEKGGGDD